MLLKVLSLNSVGVLFRFLFGLIVQKVLAVFIGPHGITLYGNLKNALSLLSTTAVLGTDQGIIKYVAKTKNSDTDQAEFIKTALCFVVVGALLGMLALFFWASQWSLLLFGTENYKWLFVVLGISVPFLSLFVFFQAILNGFSNYKAIIKISIVVSFASSVLTIVLTVLYGLKGALLALATLPIIQILAIAVAESAMLKKNWLKPKLNRFYSSKLLMFMLMAIVPAILNNIVEIGIRNNLKLGLGDLYSGCWTGMNNISVYCLSFLTGILSVYVLPRFAIIKLKKEFRAELVTIYKLVLPLFAVGFLLVFWLKTEVIAALFSKEFLPMEILFKWQFLGDFVKVVSMVLGYHILAKQMWKAFFVVEIASVILFYALSVLLVGYLGFEGIALAHFYRYMVYLIMVVLALRKWLFG